MSINPSVSRLSPKAEWLIDSHVPHPTADEPVVIRGTSTVVGYKWLGQTPVPDITEPSKTAELYARGVRKSLVPGTKSSITGIITTTLKSWNAKTVVNCCRHSDFMNTVGRDAQAEPCAFRPCPRYSVLTQGTLLFAHVARHNRADVITGFAIRANIKSHEGLFMEEYQQERLEAELAFDY